MEQAIYKFPDGTYKAFIQHAEAAMVINKRLRVYPVDSELLEGIFRFTEKDYPFVRAVVAKFVQPQGNSTEA